MEVGAIPAEQRVLMKEKRGCIEALHLDNMIASEAKHCNKNLSVAWVDYQKAFNMVPHLWIHCLLKAIKAPRAICRLLKYVIPLWANIFFVRCLASFQHTFNGSSYP